MVFSFLIFLHTPQESLPHMYIISAPLLLFHNIFFVIHIGLSYPADYEHLEENDHVLNFLYSFISKQTLEISKKIF